MKQSELSTRHVLSVVGVLLSSVAFSPVNAWARTAHRTHSHSRTHVSVPTLQNWKVSFELAFGEGTPYSKRYPNLYELPYATNRAISREVLNRIIGIALRETGAHRLHLLYGPGGYLGFPVVPSAQLDVQATPSELRTLLNVIGYLAQQSEVLACQPVVKKQPQSKAALQILQLRGHTLVSPRTVTTFWQRLRRYTSKFQGFLPIQQGRQSGLWIIDTAGHWKQGDNPQFKRAIFAAARGCGLRVQVRRFRVSCLASGNDWAQASAGQQYLQRFSGRRQIALRNRLFTMYRFQIERWIRIALAKRRLLKTGAQK